jgi:antitoxin FitA
LITVNRPSTRRGVAQIIGNRVGRAVADETVCLHNVSMPHVLVRDVPENVHSQLQRRADARGQSLQQYLAGELRRLAERPTMDEVLARIAGHRGGQVGLEQAVIDLAGERDRR